MKLETCLKVLQAKVVAGENYLDKEATSVFVGDLLSWVMAHGQENEIWISVQAHLNVLAVASLKDFAAVIIAQGAQIPQETIDKAKEEGIVLIQSDLSAYRIACKLYEAGIDNAL
ncbi:MAG: hypothetical protein RSF69_00255 [Erysipelotrichaceae bacterium]